MTEVFVSTICSPSKKSRWGNSTGQNTSLFPCPHVSNFHPFYEQCQVYYNDNKAGICAAVILIIVLHLCQDVVSTFSYLKKYYHG